MALEFHIAGGGWWHCIAGSRFSGENNTIIRSLSFLIVDKFTSLFVHYVYWGKGGCWKISGQHQTGGWGDSLCAGWRVISLTKEKETLALLNSFLMTQLERSVNVSTCHVCVVLHQIHLQISFTTCAQAAFSLLRRSFRNEGPSLRWVGNNHQRK